MSRFKFGKNWLNYAKTVSERDIEAAEMSMLSMLDTQSLAGCSFLDAGSGSGLFSLAAHRLGARPVVSFDYDSDSIACTQSVRARCKCESPDWTVVQGDVLDASWLASLGQFEIVYSWGVLHHTGNMWKALGNICASVKPGGVLFISIYNDQGWISRAWRLVKRAYTHGGPIRKSLLLGLYIAYFHFVRTVRGIVRGENPRNWYRPSGRGMTVWYDAVDWIGGYPFETAKPEQIIDYFEAHGFELSQSIIKSGSGCNEFVFRRKTLDRSPESS